MFAWMQRNGLSLLQDEDLGMATMSVCADRAGVNREVIEKNIRNKVDAAARLIKKYASDTLSVSLPFAFKLVRVQCASIHTCTHTYTYIHAHKHTHSLSLLLWMITSALFSSSSMCIHGYFPIHTNKIKHKLMPSGSFCHLIYTCPRIVHTKHQACAQK